MPPEAGHLPHSWRGLGVQGGGETPTWIPEQQEREGRGRFLSRRNGACVGLGLLLEGNRALGQGEAAFLPDTRCPPGAWADNAGTCDQNQSPGGPGG